ncbi:MAG: hypothetical protein DRJ50_15230 [Actinobacteria bacterium]|nr:MAG: hypothetical protein DRJ50_15230 [Actinomycetota bacterium]
MAYLQTVCTSQFDFISVIRSFLSGQGWNIEKYVAGEQGVIEAKLLVSFGDQFYYFQTKDHKEYGTVLISGGSGYAAPVDDASFSEENLVDRGVKIYAGLNIFLENTPMTLFHYDNADGSKQLIVPYTPPSQTGYHCFLSIGKVLPAYGSVGSNNYYSTHKYNSDTGNTFSTEMFSTGVSSHIGGPNMAVNMSNDVFDNKWFSNSGADDGAGTLMHRVYGGNGKGGGNGTVAATASNTSEALYFGMDNWVYRMSEAEHVPTTPVIIFNKYEDTTRDFIAATIPNIRRCSSLMFDPGETTTVGAEEYAIFPLTKKKANSVSDAAANNQPGFAIRVDRG